MYALNFCLEFFHTLKYFFARRSALSQEHQRISGKGISNGLYVRLLVKYAISSINTLTYNNSNGLYLVCPIGCEIINKVLSHSTLELAQWVLVHVHTTFLYFLIYCMTHHQKSYVAKSTNNYLTTIGAFWAIYAGGDPPPPTRRPFKKIDKL